MDYQDRDYFEGRSADDGWTDRQAKDERAAWRARVFGGMLEGLKIAVVVMAMLGVVALYSKQARAGEPVAGLIYSDPQVTIRLTSNPCAAPEVMKHIADDAKPYYREAVFTWEGRPLKCCWRPGSDGRVLTIDEEGDRLYPPPHISRFTPESGS